MDTLYLQARTRAHAHTCTYVHIQLHTYIYIYTHTHPLMLLILQTGSMDLAVKLFSSSASLANKAALATSDLASLKVEKVP